MKSSGFANSDVYRPGDAWFVCDRCAQRYRRSAMFTEWTGLKVDLRCLDPRPPQMQPPNVYPEGIPFFDARPPQDVVDRRWDDGFLQPTVGGVVSSNGLYPTLANGQASPPGAISPQHIIVDTLPKVAPSASVLADDVTLRTGPIATPSVDVVNDPTGPIPPGAPNPPFDE